MVGCTAHNHDPDQPFDDQIWTGFIGTNELDAEVSVCFAHDAAEPVFGGGHDWDDVVVSLWTTAGNPYLGMAEGTLALGAAAAGCISWSG